MMIFLRLYLLPIFLLALFFSCSLTQKIALSTAVVPMIEGGVREMETEANWETFQGAMLSQIKLIEGLTAQSPHHKDLLLSALKANSAYAFGVEETKWLKKKDPVHLKLALLYYSQAIRWGYRYLHLYGIDQTHLFQSTNAGTLHQLLDGLEDERGVEVIFFLAQSLSASINLQKTSPMAVIYLPLSKGLFDWVCALKPGIRFGACTIFYGAWEAGRPEMLGGSRIRAKEHFLEGMKKYPENYLIPVSYLRFYIIPGRDEGVYEKEKARLRESFKAWSKNFLWPSMDSAKFADVGNLYNAIAKKQFEMMTKEALK